MLSAPLAPDTNVWFCAFSLYQPGDEADDEGPSIDEQLKLDPFGRVISRVQEYTASAGTGALNGMAVIHTSRAEVYERLWCVYEIAVALRCAVPISVLCSDVYLDSSAGRVM